MNDKNQKEPEDASQGHTDPELRELSGYLGLGMAKEALDLARRCLERETLDARVFNEAVSAILILSESLKTWLPLVVEALRRLGPGRYSGVKFTMLAFCHTIGHYEGAAAFIPRSFAGTNGWAELAYALDIFLKLDKLKEAGGLVRLCRRGCRKVKNAPVQAMLLAGLAEYHLRTGDWDKALRFCDELRQNEGFYENGVVCPVEIHLARALTAARAGLTTLASRKKAFDPELETMRPGLERAGMELSEAKLKQLLAEIEKTLPTDRWQGLGLMN